MSTGKNKSKGQKYGKLICLLQDKKKTREERENV